MPELPIHPFTGLQALGFTSRGPIWPIMGGSQPLGEPTPDPAPQADPPAPPEPDPQPEPDRGYPPNTPIAQMTAEQQANYWKFHDRRKSDTLKAYGDITPEQARQNAQRVQELEREQMDANDRALADARQEATLQANQASLQQWVPELVGEIVGQFVTDDEQRASVLAGIDPMRFVQDGKFNKDALVGHLTGLSAAFGGAGTVAGGSGSQPRQWGQAGSQPPAKSGRDEGLAEAKRRGFIKD